MELININKTRTQGEYKEKMIIILYDIAKIKKIKNLKLLIRFIKLNMISLIFPNNFKIIMFILFR